MKKYELFNYKTNETITIKGHLITKYFGSHIARAISRMKMNEKENFLHYKVKKIY